MLPVAKLCLGKFTQLALASSVLVISGFPISIRVTAQIAPLTGAQTFSAPTGYIVHGVHLNPVATPPYHQEISNFGAAVGKDVGLVMYFRPWDNVTTPCDDGYLPRFVDPGAPAKPGAANGRTILLTWEPLSILASPGPADYDNILAGQYNSLIDTCASQLADWSNKTFLIRFMHEFNIPDSPWWAGHPYNQKGDGTGDTEKFKQVWRYVWQRFYNAQAARGVHNAQWVWSPNYGSNPPEAWNSLHNYYPGDQYVDWIGLSGYNWMGIGGQSPFQSYADLYSTVIPDLQCSYAKPIIHTEIGAATAGGYPTPPVNKEGWIADAYTQMRAFPLLRAVSWFNDYAFHNVNNADFRVWTNSNVSYNGNPGTVLPSITSAFQTAVSHGAFASTFDSSRLLNPPMTRCDTDSVSANGVLGVRPASALVARTGANSVSFQVGALGLSGDTTFAVGGCPTGATCSFASSNGNASTTRSAPWSGDTLTIVTTGSTPLSTFTLTISGGGTSTTVQITVVQELQRLYLPLVIR